MATVKLDPAKGVQIPNLTTSERNAISSPETGALIWNTTTSAINQYNGSAWSAVDTSTDNTKLPLAGGTMTGDLLITKSSGDVSLTLYASENSGAREPILNLKGYATNSNPVINFGDHAGYAGAIEYENQDNSMRLWTNASEKVRIHSNGVTSVPNGIELGSGVDATAANTLDDYEEGTWTPTAIGGLSGLTATDCHYRKIGSLVHIAGRVNAFTGINTATLQFGGLPFNPTHSTSSGTVSTTFVDLDQGYQLWMALSHDWDRIYIRYQMNNAQYNSLTGSDISSSSNIHFNATYIVD